MRLLQITLVLILIIGVLFIGGGIGHNSIDMVLTGGSSTLFTSLILTFVNFARA